MKKKLLFLTSRLPYPTSSGRKNVMFYYCKYLHEMYGYEIINVSFLEYGDDVRLKPEFISKTYELNKVGFKNKLKNLIKDTLIKNEKPLQVSLYYSDEAKQEIKRIIEIEKPDLLMCDMVRTSEYLKEYNIPKILDMDDLLSKRYSRQLGINLKDVNPYGAFLYTLPESLQKILSNSLIKRYILQKEIKLLTKYEISVSEYYDAIVFVAQNEADELNKRINSNKSFAVPLGVDIDYFNENNEIIKEKKSISFMGALSVAHNETGIIHFCENIYPLIKCKVPDAKLYIIGSGATARLKKISDKDKDIILTGRVEDTREYIKKTQVFICPLLFGSGIKTKNLEAMAMGVPVITTEIGAESIGAKNMEHWIITNENESFSNAIIDVFEDDILNFKLGKNGFDYVSQNFSWDITMKKWEEVIDYLKTKSKGELYENSYR